METPRVSTVGFLASCSGRSVPQSARLRFGWIACRTSLCGSLFIGCLFVIPGLPCGRAAKADPFTITGGLLPHAPHASNLCSPLRRTGDCGTRGPERPPAYLRPACRLQLCRGLSTRVALLGHRAPPREPAGSWSAGPSTAGAERVRRRVNAQWSEVGCDLEAPSWGPFSYSGSRRHAPVP